MGKDLNGNELGRGFRQRENGLYNARALIKGISINLSNTDLDKLRKDFAIKVESIKESNLISVKNCTLNEWFDLWCKNYKSVQVKNTSLTVIISKYNNIFGDYIGSKMLKDILNIDVQNCINQYIKLGKNAERLRSSLGNLRECFELAKVNKLVDDNPCLLITLPRAKYKDFDIKEKILSAEDEKIFMEYSVGSWYYGVFYTLLNTGLRVSELCGLKWEDVDFNKKCINVKRQLSCQYYKGKHVQFDTPKTQSGYRTIPFIADMENVLKQQYKMISDRKVELQENWRGLKQDKEFSDLVFYSTMGSPLTKETISQAIKSNIKNIKNEYPNFPYIHPHMFRHTFATKCYNAGVEPKAAQLLLGHQSTAITLNIYTHLSVEDLNKETAKITNFMDLQSRRMGDKMLK